MKYGYFDDENREYVINTPKTPYPWINYLGTEDFFSLVSNTSGGYCFYKDARLRRITRYRYNNIPIDNDGRYFYINDGTDIWSPGWMPVKKELDFYECRHGLGYTSITGEKNGIRAEQLMFVPLHFNGEVHRLRVKNTTDSQKQLTLFSYIEFCLWNAYDDMTNFQRNLNTGEVEVMGSEIYHKTEYRERRNHYSFYAVNTPIDGFDTDREAFLGQYGGLDAPQAVVAGKSGNSIASGWSPIASHCIHLDMQAGEEKTYIFVLGYVEYEEADKWEKPGVINKSKARSAIARFSSEKDVEDGISALKTYWKELLSRYMLESEDDRLNRMVNIWNPYQCMVTFNMSRSASYFESGIGRGMGFRDSNQDILGFVHQIPERARERILDIAAIQFEDGNAYHQYQPLTKKGNSDIGGGFNDDPLWLILSTSAYIKETGDFTILDEQVAFDCDKTKKASLFEHLKHSFYHVVQNLGPHGLPLIGRADWNDCLNLNCFSKTPDESFQTYGDPDGRIAESVFIAGLFVFVGHDFVELCRRKGLDGEAVEAQKQIDVMCKNILTYGFDGEWFLRAYDAFGKKVGSRECEEGQIFIEPQGFCVMAGIGVKEGLARKALDSVWDRLNTKYGIILQNTPYESYHLNLGEISSYPPGYKENAGVFCHNNPWIAIAETVIGRGDKAFKAYSQIAPSYIEDISEIHKMEPYIYSQMIAGKDAIRHGEAKNSWLTGTAAWNFAAVSQWILGIKPEYDGLNVDPCIPSEWRGFTVIRQFRGARYHIIVHNPNHVSKGIKTITINGVELSEIFDRNASGNILPVFGDGNEYDVQVEMG